MSHPYKIISGLHEHTEHFIRDTEQESCLRHVSNATITTNNNNNNKKIPQSAPRIQSPPERKIGSIPLMTHKCHEHFGRSLLMINAMRNALVNVSTQVVEVQDDIKQSIHTLTQRIDHLSKDIEGVKTQLAVISHNASPWSQDKELPTPPSTQSK